MLRSERLNIRISPLEKKALKKAAERYDTTHSGLIHIILLPFIFEDYEKDVPIEEFKYCHFQSFMKECANLRHLII
jgi:hypothetical protein